MNTNTKYIPYASTPVISATWKIIESIAVQGKIKKIIKTSETIETTGILNSDICSNNVDTIQHITGVTKLIIDVKK